MQQVKWLALGYNVPINPSKNRVYVWRKLREYGAEYFKQGVALLPKSAQSLAQLRSLAAKILDMGGEASLVEMKFLDLRDEQVMIARFHSQSEDEYLELIRDCANLMDNIQNNLFPTQAERAERMKKIMKRAGKVKSRDYFRTAAHSAVSDPLSELAGDMTRTAGELARQLRNLLE
jgi:hypothetical protein